MSYAAIAIAAAGVVTAGVGAYQSSKSAKDQARGEQDRYANLLRLFNERQPGLGAFEGLQGYQSAIEGISFDINPMDYMGEAEELGEWAMDWMRDQGEQTFNQTVRPENVGLFNSFLTDNLERANFDFSSLPEGVTRTLESSALSRGLGGPAGLAENLSVQNQMQLQQQSEQSAFRALAFRQGFMPDLVDPREDVYRLSDFERQNRQLEMQKLNMAAGLEGAMADLEMQRFAMEAGYQQPNYAGLGAAGSAQMWNTASQGLFSLGSMAGMYSQRGNSYGAMGGNQQAQIATSTSYGTTYPNPFPASQGYAGSTPPPYTY